MRLIHNYLMEEWSSFLEYFLKFKSHFITIKRVRKPLKMVMLKND
jgi:hypothetical protein